MKKKVIGIFICILMICTVLSVSANVTVDKTFNSSFVNNTLYVGGNGPNNYTKIQEAIDDAVDDDTVFVYDNMSPYIENLIINKSIILIGEDKYTTVIDGDNEEGKGNVIIIMANGVTIQGFTIQNSSHSYSHDNFFCGIEIRTDNNIIKNNNINNNQVGIKIGYWNKPKQYVYSNIIIDNEILNNNYGIQFIFATESRIEGNTITYSSTGVELAFQSDNNLIINNIINFNEWAGIYLSSIENTIEHNEITNSKYGVNSYSHGNKIIKNNIYNHEENVNETAMLWEIFRGLNEYDGNYWGEPLQQPVRIPIKCYFGLFLGTIGLIFGIDALHLHLYLYDNNPAKEPYDIPEMN